MTAFSGRCAAALAIQLIAVMPAAAKPLPKGWAAPPARNDCSSFGPGFQKVEGSDTCVRVSGSVGMEAGVRTGEGASFVPDAGRR